MTPSDPGLPGPLHRPGASLPFKIMAGLALIMTLFLVVGLLLPGTWSVTRTAVVEASPDALYPYLAEPGRWDVWTPAWEEMESTLEGPARGVGARRVWSGEETGSGALEITGVEPGRRVGYRVEVEGGLTVEGELRLEPAGPDSPAPASGTTWTRVSWTEEGDFGWNPLLAYLALLMDRIQGSEMEGSLERLGKAAAPG